MKRSFKALLASWQAELNDKLMCIESTEPINTAEPVCLYDGGVPVEKVDPNYTALLHTWTVMGRINALKSKGRIFLKELDAIITIANLKIYKS
jgi:hypothetical protein